VAAGGGLLPRFDLTGTLVDTGVGSAFARCGCASVVVEMLS
jgi:hypothetical protein